MEHIIHLLIMLNSILILIHNVLMSLILVNFLTDSPTDNATNTDAQDVPQAP